MDGGIVLSRFETWWHNLTASRDWRAFGDHETNTFRMRRWREGRWEYREANAEEAGEALYHWAVR